MKTQHIAINSDSRKLSKINDNSIDLIITSPPYWNLKDYGNENQIGYFDTYEEYLNDLNLVWSECNRVLNNGCKLCINVGDQFNRSGKNNSYKITPIHADIITHCLQLNLDFMGSIIWQKITNTKSNGGSIIMGSYPYPKNGIIKIDYEYILIFKKGGKHKIIEPEIKKQSKLTKDEWKLYFSGHWKIPGVRQNKHIAMFPPEIPKRLIKMYSFVGETIFDPFLGSGTTMNEAKKLNRNSIGYELNRENFNIIKNTVHDNNLFLDYNFKMEI